MDFIWNMYQKIKEKPGLYIGKPSLTLLNAFMNGYMIGQYEINGDDEILDDHGLLEYVERYYSVSRTAKGVCCLVCENSESEEEAFYKFFELLKEFLSEKDEK